MVKIVQKQKKNFLGCVVDGPVHHFPALAEPWKMQLPTGHLPEAIVHVILPN
jgi:hypothetical protein